MVVTKSANPLKQYLEEEGITLAEFGAKIGQKAGAVHYYTLPLDHDNFRVPREETMVRIFEATGGAVRPDHFYGLAAYESRVRDTLGAPA